MKEVPKTLNSFQRIILFQSTVQRAICTLIVIYFADPRALHRANPEPLAMAQIR